MLTLLALLLLLQQDFYVAKMHSYASSLLKQAKCKFELLLLAPSQSVHVGCDRCAIAACRHDAELLTCRAPLCSKQSVKPPVDKPESNAVSPATSIWKWSRAFSSLNPALQTYFGSSARILTTACFGTACPALVIVWSFTSTLPCAIQD